MDKSFVILELAMILFLLPWIQIFHMAPIRDTQRSPVVKWIILNVASGLLVFIATAFSTHDTLLSIKSILIVIQILVIAGLIIRYIYNPNEFKEQKTITLKKDEYEYITQEGILVEYLNMPVTEDVPLVSHVIHVKSTDEYILLIADLLTGSHDIKVTVCNVAKYGSNVYQCQSLEILDRKTFKDVISKAAGWIMYSLAVIGTVPLSYLLTCVEADPPHSIVPEWVTRTLQFSLYGFFGLAAIKLSQTTNNKILKFLSILFGVLLILAGFAGLLGKINAFAG